MSVGGTANQYQWVKNYLDIQGAVNSTYTIPSVTPADEGIYSCRVTNSIATELTLYSGTITVRVSSGTGIDDSMTRIPSGFTLYQNYPNPFNPATRISYHLPQGTHVGLKIYDLHGHEIITLVDELQTAGLKTVVWDGSDTNGKKAASGVYIYRIRTSNGSVSKKMLLMH